MRRAFSRNATGILLLTLAFSPVHSAHAARKSLECRNPVTAVDRSICSNKRLKRLDAELTANYRSVLKFVVPEGANAIVSSQRAWIAERNFRCASGATVCLSAAYQERNEILLALLARTSIDNPIIDAADPAILLGTWLVGANGRVATTSTRLATAAHLPPAGARLVAKAGELCVVEPEDSRICSQFALAIEQAKPRNKHGDRTAVNDSVVMLTYFGGQADFELMLGSNHELTATFRVCEDAARNCEWMQQRWEPQSPNAAGNRYHLFGSLEE